MGRMACHPTVIVKWILRTSLTQLAFITCRNIRPCPGGYNPNCVSTASLNDVRFPPERYSTILLRVADCQGCLWVKCLSSYFPLAAIQPSVEELRRLLEDISTGIASLIAHPMLPCNLSPLRQ